LFKKIGHPALLPRTVILGQKVLKIRANVNMPISVLNVRESPEFSCYIGNWGWGTQQWCEISDQK